MFDLPKSTIVNKFIPKNTFYDKDKIAPIIKNEFISYINKIVWKYKLAEDTIGITKHKDIEEIQIFEITLKEKIIPKKAIKYTTKIIQYPILFILRYQEEFCYLIKLKELEKFYISDWNEKITFEFNAINFKNLYEKIISKFIKDFDTEITFKEKIEINEKYENLNKEIINLRNKIKKEKQFNKKVELNKQLISKNKELEDILNV